jgi:hypothetical protein
MIHFEKDRIKKVKIAGACGIYGKRRSGYIDLV